MSSSLAGTDAGPPGLRGAAGLKRVFHIAHFVHNCGVGSPGERRVVETSINTLTMSPFIGSEAIAHGVLTRGRLRWNYTAIYPDVYLDKEQRLDVRTKAQAAWLWTRRTGIVAGRAAAALHGASAVSDSAPIELIAKQRRPQPGLIVRDERIGADEVQTIASMRATSPARTALDLARHLPRDEAVVILDQLAAVTGVDYRQAVELVNRYRGARGVERGWTALSLMDGGARSPMETRMRLALIDGGLPAPRAGIVVGEGPVAMVIGMGWERAKVGVSYSEPEELSIAQTNLASRTAARAGVVRDPGGRRTLAKDDGDAGPRSASPSPPMN